MWHLTVPVKSHKAQLEAMHSSKQSDFKMDFDSSAEHGLRRLSRAVFDTFLGFWLRL